MASSTDRQILQAIRQGLGKFLREPSATEKRRPLELLQLLKRIKTSARIGVSSLKPSPDTTASSGAVSPATVEATNVGSFQVSEMIGDRWDLWKKLFVPSVPARSKILTLDIPTVVTGPRGCGKTMLFRRLSERLVIECGDDPILTRGERFAAFYINANDIADAFAQQLELLSPQPIQPTFDPAYDDLEPEPMSDEEEPSGKGKT